MGFVPKKQKRRSEWQISLSPDETKKRRHEAKERQKAIAERSTRSRGTHNGSAKNGSNSARSGALRAHVVAFGLGIADGALGVISPEVWTTNLAVRHARRGLSATISATAGSLVGGALTYYRAQELGKRRTRNEFLDRPGITAETLSLVERESKKYGARAVISGLVEDIPYAAYAREQGLRDADLQEFLGWSAVNRLTRFGALTAGTAVASGLAHGLAPRLTKVAAPVALNAAWIAYYRWRWAKSA
ncbi:hypothetical protein [Kocuria massiliensis]|uniref:hypothetical protein n=1 Tax=Kocuria massiliensis TaxID=1926282 RepID=UPI000A1CDBD2|nr:hypothetical protein [Kocuria massiliensis]